RRAPVQTQPEKPEPEKPEEDTNVMPSFGLRTQTPAEGVTVTGEAVRRIAPESAEFLIEITAAAPTAAPALRDSQAKAAQLAQTLAPFGVHAADIQPVSSKVQSMFSPVTPSLPGFSGPHQIGPGALPGFFGAAPVPQPEVQFGSYVANNT